MSYQLNQERGLKREIDMPPLPVEEVRVQPELQEQEVELQAVEQEPEEIEVIEEVKPIVQESQNAKNIKALRERAERAERAERERDDLMRRVQELELSRNQQPKPIIEEEKYTELAPDDLVEAKYLKKYDKRIKELEEKLSQTEQKTTFHSVEARLKAKYPDIDNVVSKDNLEILRATYPELAESINSNNDFYNKAVSAYTLIRKLGISPEDNYQQDKERAQKNAAKPRPLTSVNPQQGDSPLSKANAFANGLTDELRMQLRKEMAAARKDM